MADLLFRIEVTQEYITPVNANTEREAREKVLLGEGKADDSYPGKAYITIINVVDQ